MAMTVELLGDSTRRKGDTFLLPGSDRKMFLDIWVVQAVDDVYAVTADLVELQLIKENFEGLVIPKNVKSITFYGDAAKTIVKHWNQVLEENTQYVPL
jgi:hypothetical protein